MLSASKDTFLYTIFCCLACFPFLFLKPMKSLKEFSLNLPEDAYHKYPAWSHSLIARYAREGFSAVATIHEPIKTTSAMAFGSLFDSILTRGKDTLNEYVIDDTTAPPAEKSVFDWLLSAGHKEPFEEISTADINFATDACKFYQNLKPETRYEKLRKASTYYEVRRAGKKIVSRDDWDDAVSMAHAFRNDEFLSKLFGTKNTQDVEYIYQAQFVVDLGIAGGGSVKVKIMPDLLVVNHKNKTIRPVDLKTSTQPAYDFKESFLAFRYDLEASVYTDILEIVISQHDEYKDYTILPYYFTDISRSDKVPVTYEYDPKAPDQIDGFHYTSKGREYKHKHWTTLLGEILAYEDSKAVVPAGIKTDGPNDLMSIINHV